MQQIKLDPLTQKLLKGHHLEMESLLRTYPWHKVYGRHSIDMFFKTLEHAAYQSGALNMTYQKLDFSARDKVK